jgi:hypothetical protein
MFDRLFSRILPIMVVPNGTTTISRQLLITLANVALFCWISGLTTGFFALRVLRNHVGFSPETGLIETALSATQSGQHDILHGFPQNCRFSDRFCISDGHGLSLIQFPLVPWANH